MAWQTIKTAKAEISRGIPQVSIGFSRIAFNAEASKLLGDYSKYKFALFLKDNDRPNYIGIRFLVDYSENIEPDDACGKISRKKYKDTFVAGMEISSKRIAKDIFGEMGTTNKVTKRNVIKGDEEDMLIILPQ